MPSFTITVHGRPTRVAQWDPDVVVVQGGCDAVSEDPLSRMSLSDGALWDVIAAISRAAPRLLCLGGGGYNPWAVGRAWAGVWGTLRGVPIPDTLPEAAADVLLSLT